jgi:hypothetical protein
MPPTVTRRRCSTNGGDSQHVTTATYRERAAFCKRRRRWRGGLASTGAQPVPADRGSAQTPDFGGRTVSGCHALGGTAATATPPHQCCGDSSAGDYVRSAAGGGLQGNGRNTATRTLPDDRAVVTGQLSPRTYPNVTAQQLRSGALDAARHCDHSRTRTRGQPSGYRLLAPAPGSTQYAATWLPKTLGLVSGTVTAPPASVR